MGRRILIDDACIKANGGTIEPWEGNEKWEMKGLGWFSRATDTEGNTFGLLQAVDVDSEIPFSGSTCAEASNSAIGAMIMTKSGTIIPVMLMKTNSVCRSLVIRSKSRIAWVNQITIVRLTSVIRNAIIVTRKM